MLNEEEKKAIEYLTKYIHWETLGERSLETDISTVLNLITKLQKENEEKDKQIDLMAEKLVQAHEWFYSEFDNFTKEDFIRYYENKVKGE